MSSVQIPSIEFKDNRIQKCSLVIDKQTFNVIYSNDKYTVTKGSKVVKEAPNEASNESQKEAPNESPKEVLKDESSKSVKASKPVSKPKAAKAAKAAKAELNVSDIQNAAKAFSKM